MKYEPVIGLEVHVELNTKTKMFCRCSADYFGKEPNTSTCPVCLGLPGALPFINQQAIENCVKIGLALNCSINEKSYFERKNYFYPDLAKGFQTSQLVLPIAVRGWIEVEDAEGKLTKIRINRAHQEEDTAKLMHGANGKSQSATDESIGDTQLALSNLRRATLIDFNRSGVPLVEVVTEPDFTDTFQIKDYAKKLQQIFRYLGVSNADMERGDMRLEANISVRPVGQVALPDYRVELKNINSFRFMAQAVEYEITRQSAALDRGERLVQETRGWNEDKRITYLQRSKEEAHDYRYFPEPDLPEMRLQELESRIKSQASELPEAIKGRLIQKGLPKDIAKVIAQDKEYVRIFEEALALGLEEGLRINDIYSEFIHRPGADIKKTSPRAIVDDALAKKSGIISDDFALEQLAREVINENPGMIEIYRSGKTTVVMALVGGVMSKSGGKADPAKVKAILERLLS